MTVRDPASAPPPPDEPPQRGLPLPRFTAMRYRDFRYYWISTATLFTDQGMANVALPWLVLELTDSAGWAAVAVAVRGLPLFLLTMPAGVLADRWNRRMLLVVTQLVGGFRDRLRHPCRP